jgi:hypothetical protein
VFERYTEEARRAVFFARYEASQFGSDYIEPEHMLLAILRESQRLRDKLPPPVRDRIRSQIETRTPTRSPLSTSVDLPLSHALKRALAYGSEEAETMQHRHIEAGHLILGLLHLEKSIAAELLRENGITLEEYRETVASVVTAREMPPHRLADSTAEPLKSLVRRFESLIEFSATYLSSETEKHGRLHLKRKPWTRKQALGHLIDWATTHHQWLARALIGPQLSVAGYPEDDWVRVQNYDQAAWRELIDTWVNVNHLLVHVLSQIPEERLNVECRIGIQPPIPLSTLIERYLDHCEDTMQQILTRR